MDPHPPTNTQPLTKDEIDQAMTVVKANFDKPVDGYFVVVALIDLKEPNKTMVLAGTNTQRRAEVLLYENFENKTTKFIVLLGNNPALESKEYLPGVIPPMNDRNSGSTVLSGPNGDFDTLVANVRKMIEANTPEANKYKAGLDKRQIKVEDIGDRYYPCLECTFEMLRVVETKCCCLQKELCKCPEKLGPNDQGRFFLLTLIDERELVDIVDSYVDGLNAIVNVTYKEDSCVGKIVRTLDEYHVPELTGDGLRNPLIEHPVLNKVKLCQENNTPSYEYNHQTGHLKWDNWSFNIGFSSRTGVQFYDIKYRTKYSNGSFDAKRQVIYKASVSDAIVVYNTDKPQLLRNFVSSDTFSYPMGYRLAPLRPGIDVPELATLYTIASFDNAGTAFDENNDPQGDVCLLNALGIFEEWSDTVWRANDGADLPPGAKDIGAIGNNLVIRTLFSGFFYLWQFSWTFRQDGIIDLDIRIGGRTINQYISWETNADKLRDLGYLGEFITKYKFGLNHTHIHNIRIDFAIDGLENTVVEESWNKLPSGYDKCLGRVVNGCGHSLDVVDKVLKSEKRAVRDLDPANGVSWKVENTNVQVPGLQFESHPGYTIIPWGAGYQTQNFSQCSSSRTQFKFTQHNLFVTRYDEAQQNASGEFPIENTKDTGLGAYISGDKNIVNKDVVCWVTMPISHEPHNEDESYIPLVGQKLRLAPHNFFPSNPALLMDAAPVPPPEDAAKKLALRHMARRGRLARQVKK